MFELAVQKGGRPHVKFETRSEEDRNASVEAGKKVYIDRDWVVISPPGGKDVVENHASQWLTNIRDRAQVGQYDPEWVDIFSKMYGLYKEGKELPEEGTPLRMCTTLFTPAEIQNCLGANVRSLEMLADANEEALGRIGMGARSLKNRAQESIKIGEGKEGAMKVDALMIENKELREKVESLSDIVTEMREQLALSAPRARRAAKQEEAV